MAPVRLWRASFYRGAKAFSENQTYKDQLRR